jgi:tRNA A37 N6-isopentenylltransferase MiaA
MAKKKFRLQSVGFCKSCNIEIINTDSFVIYADRKCQHTACMEKEYNDGVFKSQHSSLESKDQTRVSI